MEHVVFYPSAEGVPAFERVNSIEAAVSFVEHLRNSENITEFSVHSLTTVPLSFRAYYHVEVPAEDGADAATADVAEPAAEVSDPTLEPAAEAAAEPTEPVAEAADEPVQDAPVAEAADVESPVEPEQSAAPVEAVDTDRSAEWVAEAPVVEAPAPAAADVPAAVGPFADAPPVTPADDTDVVPVPAGRRSMGFFAR